MLTVPQEIKDLLHQDTCPKNIRIHFPGGERTDICNNLIVKDSVSFKESLCSQDTLKFGLTEASVFECEVVGVENIKGMTIEVFCEIFCDSTVSGAIWQTDLERYVYQIPYGNFAVDESKRQADMQHRKIVAYGGTAQFGSGLAKVEKMKQNYGESTSPNYVANAFKLAISNLELEDVSENIFFIENVAPKKEGGAGVVVEWGTQNPSHSYRCYARVVRDVWAWGGTNSYPVEESNNLYKIEIDHMDYHEAYELACEEIQRVFDEYGYQGEFPDTFIWTDFIPAINIPRYNIEKSLVFYLYKGTRTNYEVAIPKYFRIELFDNNVLIYTKDIDYVSHHALKRTTPLLSIFDSITLAPEVYYDSRFGQYKIKWPEDFDNRELLNGLLEICGLFGELKRNNQFDGINIKQRFGLTPSSSLYPGSSVHPQSVTGGTLVPNDYQKCWYDDAYCLPFGAIQCMYKNTSNEDTVLTYYLTGYSAGSDISTYKIYDLSDNYIIKSYTWTQTQIEAICATIADNIEGVTYMPVDFVGRGLPYVEAGDTFEILTRSNDSITTIVLNRTISGEQMLTDSYKSV